MAEPFRVETVELDLPALSGAFSRRLHDAGLPVTPGRAVALARSLALVRPVSRRRLYWTARSALVTDPSQLPVFDRVFGAVFGLPPAEPAAVPPDAPTRSAPPDERPAADRSQTDAPARQRGGGLSVGDGRAGDQDADDAVDVPRALASDEERLGQRRFEDLAPAELARVYDLMTRLQLATPQRRSRRYRRGRHGERIDLRRTLRRSLRTGGDPFRLARRRRRLQRRRLVLLCDISGSMEPYARAYLQFLTCAAGSGPHAEAFVFATRLTRITRALAARRPERAIQRAAAAAPDWSSGTRIGEALKTFNDRHGRRGMARGAVVVMLSDGWERGDPELVGREMARLHRLAHRIVWVNPRVAASAFAVAAGGMRAALPYCDALVSGHSFAALREVVEAIGAPRWQRAPGNAASAPPAEKEDPWASATPVAGSSVAMPSGHGPSRGHTTPGWVTDEEGAR